MTSRRNVSDEVFQRIIQAINRIEVDAELRRTKRQIEQVAGLSHDVVARAFRQDLDNEGVPWQINAKFNALLGEQSSGLSLHQEEVRALRRTIADKNKEIAALKRSLDAHAIALYAFAAAQQQSETDPIPIGRNRRRRQ